MGIPTVFHRRFRALWPLGTVPRYGKYMFFEPWAQYKAWLCIPSHRPVQLQESCLVDTRVLAENHGVRTDGKLQYAHSMLIIAQNKIPMAKNSCSTLKMSGEKFTRLYDVFTYAHLKGDWSLGKP